MKYNLTNIIVCPKCQSQFDFEATSQENLLGSIEIKEGVLICKGGHRYPVVQGIPVLLADLKKEQLRTMKVFGFEWKHFKDYIVDNLPNFLYPLGTDSFFGKKILDAGCGGGRHIFSMADKGAALAIGIDISEATQVAYAKTKNLSNMHIIQTDIGRLPFHKGYFDLIYSVGVLHHLPAPFKAFKYLTGFLTPNGEMLITVYKKTLRKIALEFIRVFTKNLPIKIQIVFAFFCAVFDYVFLIKPYKFLSKSPYIKRFLDNCVSHHVIEYAKYSFKENFTDWYDRLSAPISSSYTEQDIREWFLLAGLCDIEISSIDSFWIRGYGKRPSLDMIQVDSKLSLRRILVIHLAGLGDLVMASPALRALRKRYPEARISIFVLSENQSFLAHCPYVDEVYSLKRKPSLGNLFYNIQTLIKLNKARFDIGLNLYNLYSSLGALKMWFLFFTIHPQKSLGRDTDKKGFFYNFKIEDYFKTDRHQVYSMLDVVNFLGSTDTQKNLEIWTSVESEARIEQFFKKHGITASDIIVGINPGAGRPSRRWPLEYFAQLTSMLLRMKNAKVILIGSNKEKKLAAEIKRRVGLSVINACGEFNIEDLVSFIKRCMIFISNDTGPMHVANALKVPLIALMGGGAKPTQPYNKEKCIILKKQFSCSPCYKFKCKDLGCLRAISPEEVFSAAEKLI